MKVLDAEIEIEAFKKDYQNFSKEYLVSKWVLEKMPFIFNENVEEYLKFKIQLSELLKVDSCSIIFVGSSCVGFSMSPHKMFKPFDEKSDVDIAIISNYYFDIAWHTLRNIDPYGKPPDTYSAIKTHSSRLVYWGTIATDKILGLMPFGGLWLNAINEIQKYKEFENRDINFRLYRDHESLRAYHIMNFKKNISSIFEVESTSIKL